MSDYLMIDSPVISAGWGSPRILSIEGGNIGKSAAITKLAQVTCNAEENGVGSVRGKGVAVFAYHTFGIVSSY